MPVSLHGFEHGLGVMDGGHVEDAGRAGGEQLVDTEPGGGLQRVRGVRGFHRPDALGEPVQELEVVGLISKQRLAEMHVGLHEARRDDEAVGLENRRAFRRGRAGGGELRDPAFGRNFDLGAQRAAASVLGEKAGAGDPGGVILHWACVRAAGRPARSACASCPRRSWRFR